MVSGKENGKVAENLGQVYYEPKLGSVMSNYGWARYEG
jgi:hypothetical protein